MSIRTKVLSLVDVMMRVPPILVIDEILKIGMGLPTRFYPASAELETGSADRAEQTIASSAAADATNGSSAGALASLKSLFSSIVSSSSASALNSTVADATTSASASSLDMAIENASATAAAGGILSSSFGQLMDELAHDANLSDILSLTTVKFVVCVLGFLCAACVFLLGTRHLVMVYMFVISLALTFLSYWSNVSTVAIMENNPCILEDVISFNTTRLLETDGVAFLILPQLIKQWMLGMLFAYIHLGPRSMTLQKWMPLIFASPILLAILPLPPKVIKHTPMLAVLVPLILTKMTLLSSAMEAGKTVYNGYQYAMNFVANFGLSALIENEWQRLNVPSVLRVFWTMRVTQGMISIVMTDSIGFTNILPHSQKLLVDGCETLTAVLGMTAVISLICHYIGKVFQWYLLTFDNDEEKSLGTVSAVLFYILALQTGLTSLSPDKRFVRLCRNLCLLVTALLHFLHNIVSPIMMSLSAARNPSRKRHIRALSMCAFLVITPICLLTTLWGRHNPSTWLLAVSAFSVEVIVKVLVSLATYTLFLLDARRQTFWEKLDDYLYYVRAFGNSVEFCFGILLFFNGAWILIFESGGAIRAIMMCIHAYFNIWCEAWAGWSVFMKRRSAVHKISALPEATPAQLRAFDDVCAICYQEMYSAKITRCRHYFHGVCLRKWLYVQDRCPLCHEIMMYTDKSDEAGENDEPEAAEPVPPMQIYPLDDTSASDLQQSQSQSSASTERSDNVMTSSTERIAVAATATSSATPTTTTAAATVASGHPTHSFRLSPNANVGVQD